MTGADLKLLVSNSDVLTETGGGDDDDEWMTVSFDAVVLAAASMTRKGAGPALFAKSLGSIISVLGDMDVIIVSSEPE